MNSEQPVCPIWGSPARPLVGSGHRYDSARAGGVFELTRDARNAIGNAILTDDQRIALTEWLVRRRMEGTGIPTIGLREINDVRSIRPLSTLEKRNRALLWVARTAEHFGARVPIVLWDVLNSNIGSPRSILDEGGNRNTAILTAECQNRNCSETATLLHFMVESGLVKHDNGYVTLTFKGYAEVDNLEDSTPLGDQAFVAMWFSESMNHVYQEGIAPGIVDAGYSPFRIDQKEHNNMIDDEIIAEIRRSRFLVADFTSEIMRKVDHPTLNRDTVAARGGVYFEAGFAKGLGKEVIWTVSKDVLDFTHFDTRQFAHIVWEQPADLRAKLSQRISATLGDGPKRKQ